MNSDGVASASEDWGRSQLVRNRLTSTLMADSFEEALLGQFRLVDSRHRLLASRAIERYFNTEGERFSGSQFEALIDVANPDVITERDLIAVNTLSVEIPIRASLWILSAEGKAATKRCLAAVDPSMNIWDDDAGRALGPGGPMRELWDLLGTAAWPAPRPGNGLGGRTKRSKLLAAKRPGLIPVTDRVVRSVLPKVEDYWTAFRHALITKDVRDEIEAATGKAPDGVTLLRRIDAAIWTMAQYPKAETRARHQVGVCQSPGFAAYFSFDQEGTLAHFSREDAEHNQTVEMIDENIRYARSSGDPRAFVAVIEGGLDFLRTFQDGLHEPDLIVFVSDASTLRRLGVDVVDEAWTESDGRIDLSKYL